MRKVQMQIYLMSTMHLSLLYFINGFSPFPNRELIDKKNLCCFAEWLDIDYELVWCSSQSP